MTCWSDIFENKTQKKQKRRKRIMINKPVSRWRHVKD